MPHCQEFSKVNFECIEDFLAFFKEVDLDSLPKIPVDWKRLNINADPNKCSLSKVTPDVVLG